MTAPVKRRRARPTAKRPGRAAPVGTGPGAVRPSRSGSRSPAVSPPPWQVLAKRRLYESEWINLSHWSVRLPDGRVIPDHHVLEYPRQAAGILPIGDDGRVLLIDHYRFITDTRGWEVPSGAIEAGESVRAAARRELLEETGHAARRWSTLGRYHPSNGSSNQTFHVLVARGLRRLHEPLDRNETLGLRWFTPAEVRRLVARNALRDGFSLTALAWALVTGTIG